MNCPRTTFPGSTGCMARRTRTFSSRRRSGSNETGGSMARTVMTWNRWVTTRRLRLVAPRPVLAQLLHGVVAREVPGHVGESLRELVPLLPGGLLPRELLDLLARVPLPVVIGHLRPGVPHDGDPLGQ